jgi:hypothetical protein
MADQEDLLTCMRGLIKEHKRAKKKKRDSLKRKAGRMEGADSSGDGFSPHGSGSSSCSSSSSTQTTASSTSSTFDVVMNGLDKEANFVERLLREAETQSPHYVALVRSNQAVDALLALIKYSMKREVSRTGTFSLHHFLSLFSISVAMGKVAEHRVVGGGTVRIALPLCS